MALKGPVVLALDFGEVWEAGDLSSQRTRSTVDVSATAVKSKGKDSERLTTETLWGMTLSWCKPGSTERERWKQHPIWADLKESESRYMKAYQKGRKYIFVLQDYGGSRETFKTPGQCNIHLCSIHLGDPSNFAIQLRSIDHSSELHGLPHFQAAIWCLANSQQHVRGCIKDQVTKTAGCLVTKSNQVCEATTWQSEHLPEKDNTFCVCVGLWNLCGYGSIPIDTFFSGMNIHLPAILGFTRYQGFDPSPCVYQMLHQVYCLHQSFWIFFLCTSNSRQIRLSSGVLQLSTNARDHFAR